MSEPENFLTRWARRKRAAAAPADDAAPEAAPEAAAPGSRADTPAAEAATPPAPELEFDLSTLPPIETITATTDIRAFLAPGVPPELARAALRRAWVADPAIRDFVGIAENQWDFSDPNAIPGFGSLGPLDDVRRLVAQVIGEAREEDAEPRAASAEKPLAGKADTAPDLSEPTATTGEAGTPPDAQATGTAVLDVECDNPDAAVHIVRSEDDAQPRPEASTKRAHGGALPK